jgi:hypothetical protein
MDMSLKSLETYRRRYSQAGRIWKGRLLDEVCAMEGWTRKHAIKVLCRRVRRKAKPPRGRKPIYGPAEVGVLECLWLLMDQPCGKLMAPGLSDWTASYERHFGKLPAKVRNRLVRISAAQIDRLLASCKVRHPRKGRTGGGNVHLRNQIPIRVGPWSPETPPGFLELDTVAHGGTTTAGTFLWTLTATDISSGWTLLAPAWGCGQHSVLEAFEAMLQRVPFRVRGIDTDNGNEFINYHLYAWIQAQSDPIEFTRSRARRKNDNAHVEQKNSTHVRQQLGYDRYDHPALADPLRRFYESFELFRNLFIPGFKLLGKERIGAKVRKIYGERMTPCERILRHPDTSPEVARALRELRDRHDPIELSREVQRRKNRFFEEVQRRAGARSDRLRRAGHGPFSPTGPDTRPNSTIAPAVATV